jgi:hypothetical protein
MTTSLRTCLLSSLAPGRLRLYLEQRRWCIPGVDDLDRLGCHPARARARVQGLVLGLRAGREHLIMARMTAFTAELRYPHTAPTAKRPVRNPNAANRHRPLTIHPSHQKDERPMSSNARRPQQQLHLTQPTQLSPPPSRKDRNSPSTVYKDQSDGSPHGSGIIKLLVSLVGTWMSRVTSTPLTRTRSMRSPAVPERVIHLRVR